MCLQVLFLYWSVNSISPIHASPTLLKPNTTESLVLVESQNDTGIELFHWEDYSVLAAMLIISCGIGVFYGYFGEKQMTGDDFLLGGSSMGTFPMALSLAARLVLSMFHEIPYLLLDFRKKLTFELRR